ncbi:MAG: DEAD/DEAH box helicase [Ignavibacteriales bacterium]|nr:DEAD/DEAH box helicase [Ignavibacteriales bacterium]
MSRPLTERHLQLRDWQIEARRATREKFNAEKNFLCVATPGAGKTKFALCIVHELMKEKLIDRVVVVTPSDNLKRQWAAEAAAFAGLDIDPDFVNAHGIETADFHGIAITYALLGQDKKGVHLQNTFNRRTFVIFDEIHHAGESLTWGDAIKKSFENAVFRLSLSGTPFRSDDAVIPFITYENGISKADYTYSYERAIKENVCRPVYFTIHDGRMKWKVHETEFEHGFKDSLQKDQVSKRLKTALDSKGNFVRDVMKSANEKLSEIRTHHSDAAGLIFAATQQHAKEIAHVVQEITGELPPIVISEDADGSEKIQQFKNATLRWLVSVKMVSEGIDIPRLRVGVYFTIVKAELFFRQAIGRFVRVLSHLQAQDAFIFIPQDRDIVHLAESIQEERDHALDEAERAKNNGGGDTDLFGDEYTPALRGNFVPLASESTTHKTIAVNVEISSGARHGIDHRKIEDENPVYIQKEILRDRLNMLAKRYALKKRNGSNIKPDFKLAHKIWIEKGGKNMDIETIDELKRREQFYINLLRSN